MNTSDNIAAPASAIGGAITVIRVSGPNAIVIGSSVWHGSGSKQLSELPPRTMHLGKVGKDQVLAVAMPSPRSYTGDDVVELHCHGGAAAVSSVLHELLNAGCRMAEPGEFTYRAFLNGKLDLVQAEAVADVISSSSSAALALAERQLSGALSERINSLLNKIDSLRSECEARLDFPDENLDFDEHIDQSVKLIENDLETLITTRNYGSILRSGIRVVLAGRPNAGKSSLFNLLAGYDRAIVSEIPGTTRDTVECDAVLRDIPVHLIDTAGLRTETTDPIEQLGIERSRQSLAAAELTLWILDASGDITAEVAEMPTDVKDRFIAVWNKIDIKNENNLPELPVPTVKISAKTGNNLETLLDMFCKVMFSSNKPNFPEVAINARCFTALETAKNEVAQALDELREENWELATERLASASHAVGLTIGRTVEPDLLDEVFRNFCIGK